jgi:hypothetical protein
MDLDGVNWIPLNQKMAAVRSKLCHLEVKDLQ